MRNETTYEVNRNGKSEYYRTLREAKAASGPRPIWKIVRGTAELVKYRGRKAPCERK